LLDHPVPELTEEEDVQTLAAIEEGIAQLDRGQGIPLEAWEDFFQIYDYIATDDPAAAARFCDGLLNHAGLLGTFPHIGVPSARFARCDPSCYRVDEAREVVEIIHFWHTARRKPAGM
jgi:plasmid stabilization system protein ParE